jgi:hypothetical protein
VLGSNDKTYKGVCPAGHGTYIVTTPLDKKLLIVQCPHCGMSLKLMEFNARKGRAEYEKTGT